jgi:hypothetical protein
MQRLPRRVGDTGWLVKSPKIPITAGLTRDVGYVRTPRTKIGATHGCVSYPRSQSAVRYDVSRWHRVLHASEAGEHLPMTSNIIEVWIAMNEAGDYEVAKDEDDVVDLWNENVGGLSRRLVRLRVTMSAPTVTEADVNVPEEAGRAVNVEID